MRWEEKVWGYTGASGLIQGFAMGYFLWDLVITGMNLGIFGLGMLAHAVSALFVFSLGFVSPLLSISRIGVFFGLKTYANDVFKPAPVSQLLRPGIHPL